jgi:small GTP-binding protein
MKINSETPPAVLDPIPDRRWHLKFEGEISKPERQMTRTSIKLIIVGPSGVGKTSLVEYFMHEQLSTEVVSTVSPAFANATITLADQTQVDLQIWDTAGQEKYQSISQMFYREAHVALICYFYSDISFIAGWASRVRELAPKCAVYLVATKADLLTLERDIKGIRRDSAALAERLKATFFLTSSVTGQGVRELFESAAKAGVDLIAGSQVSIRVEKPPAEAKCCAASGREDG